MAYYEKHIFICTNEKDGGRKCCAQANAYELCKYAKKQLKNSDLAGPGKVRVSFSGCLGRCSEGPALVIYPQQIWYTYQNKHDIDDIIEHDILHDQRVKRLLLPQEPVLGD